METRKSVGNGSERLNGSKRRGKRGRGEGRRRTKEGERKRRGQGSTKDGEEIVMPYL
jgi:hypothetical protein